MDTLMNNVASVFKFDSTMTNYVYIAVGLFAVFYIIALSYNIYVLHHKFGSVDGVAATAQADLVKIFAGTENLSTTHKTSATPTITAAELVQGTIYLTDQSTSAFTFPTAASVVEYLGTDAVLNNAFTVVIVNGNSGTFTLTAGSGNTAYGTLTAATHTTMKWTGVLTNVTASSEEVTYYRSY